MNDLELSFSLKKKLTEYLLVRKKQIAYVPVLIRCNQFKTGEQ